MPFLNEVLVANGTTALGRIVYTKAVLDIITNDHVLTMTVAAGGTGYVVGETFELNTGTAVGGYVARGVVTAEAAGVVTAVKIISAGAYSADPTLTAGTTANSSAAGNNDLTITVTMQTARWTLDSSDYLNDTTDFEWICTSVKTLNPATIGMQTATSGGNDAARLMVASGYNAISTWDAQPDTSPVSNMYLNIPTQNPEVFLSTTERRVNIIARDGNNVQYGGMGLFIPLTNTDASYPFPGIVHAQSRTIQGMSTQYNTDGNGGFNCGVLHPAGFTTQYHSSRYRDNLSTSWKTIAREGVSASVDACVWPNAGFRTDVSFSFAPQVSSKTTDPFGASASLVGILSDQSGNGSSGGWFHNAAGAAEGVQGVAPIGTGLQSSFVVTGHILAVESGVTQVIGIFDGFEAVHGVGLTAFEEVQSFNEASRYIVFPDTNTATVELWCAMEII